jgi:hypothetical protein
MSAAEATETGKIATALASRNNGKGDARGERKDKKSEQKKQQKQQKKKRNNNSHRQYLPFKPRVNIRRHCHRVTF